MLAPRPLLLAAVLLALAPSAAFAQAADDPATSDDPGAAATADDPCDDACAADDAADDADVADDDAAADDDIDVDDADADAPPAPGSLDAALDDGWVKAGSFAAPGVGKLRVLLYASPGGKGPVLGRATFKATKRATLQLKVELTGLGERYLEDAADADEPEDVSLVARTTWTAKKSHHVRTTERRVTLPVDLG